jgi:hypothetical protein
VTSLALDENLRPGAGKRVARPRGARRLGAQARKAGNRQQPSADKAREFEREMDVHRNSVRRMERLAADSERSAKAAAE